MPKKITPKKTGTKKTGTKKKTIKKKKATAPQGIIKPVKTIAPQLSVSVSPHGKLKISYSPFRSNRSQKLHNHKMYAKKDKGTNKNFVDFSTFKVDEDDKDFQIGATGSGLTLRQSTIVKRGAHSFRTADLALDRILTYLAENMLSYLNAQDYEGLAEIQIGWITELNTLLITENDVCEFNVKIKGKSAGELLGIMTTKGTSKLKTQGLKDYFEHRMSRHDTKLQELLASKVRYDDWVKLDPNVKPLIAFLTGSCAGVHTLQQKGSTLTDIANKIVHYDDSFGYKKGSTKHAEIYHLEVFEQVATTGALMTVVPHYYVAGTKRACSTCAGVLEEYSKKKVLVGKLHADYDHPGNLWTAQNVNQSDTALGNTLRNLKAKKIYVTTYKKPGKGKRKTYDTSGFNSDSDSDNEYD